MGKSRKEFIFVVILLFATVFLFDTQESVVTGKIAEEFTVVDALETGILIRNTALSTTDEIPSPPPSLQQQGGPQTITQPTLNSQSSLKQTCIQTNLLTYKLSSKTVPIFQRSHDIQIEDQLIAHNTLDESYFHNILIHNTGRDKQLNTPDDLPVLQVDLPKNIYVLDYLNFYKSRLVWRDYTASGLGGIKGCIYPPTIRTHPAPFPGYCDDKPHYIFPLTPRYSGVGKVITTDTMIAFNVVDSSLNSWVTMFCDYATSCKNFPPPFIFTY